MKWQQIGNIAGRDGVNGKDASPLDQAAIIEAVVARIPTPKDGANGKDGSSVTVEQVREFVAEEIRSAVQALPTPKDGLPGKDADLDVMRATIAEMVKQIPPARDGRDGKDAPPVDLENVAKLAAALVPTPKDGRDGRDGSQGKAGADGRDGKDGMSIEDFEVTLEGRTFTFALRCGERVVTKEIKVGFPLDRGVWKHGTTYEKGDVVTFGGSQWIALKDGATSKPPSDEWRCQVSRGKDGRDLVREAE